MNFFDMKCHLLPASEAFGQCPQDMNMAMCMVYDAHNQGSNFILVTPPDLQFLKLPEYPHPESVKARFDHLCREIHFYMPDVVLGLGCELHCTRNEVEKLIVNLDSKKLPTMGRSNYILVSFPDNISREDLWFCVNRFSERGYRPVISHAQSIHTLRTNNAINEIHWLKTKGCLIQVDTISFSEDAHWSDELVRAGVVDILGTCARNTYTHPPHIKKELKHLKGICSASYFDAITCENAKKILSALVEQKAYENDIAK